MKIAKMYCYWAKKYTSKAKIILLKQYTAFLKFCRNTPASEEPKILLKRHGPYPGHLWRLRFTKSH